MFCYEIVCAIIRAAAAPLRSDLHGGRELCVEISCKWNPFSKVLLCSTPSEALAVLS